jgi:hypothetical protein
MRISNRFKEAFKESFNVVGLASAAAASAALLNPLPLLVGLVAEAAYLLFVPDSRWYEARLEKRYDAEVEKRREQLKQQILPMLRAEMQSRFDRLEQTRRDIVAQPMEGQPWFREVLRKLDYLLEKFLLFASKEVEFRRYLRSVYDEVRGEKKMETSIPFDIQFLDDRPRRARPKTDAVPISADERYVQQVVSEVQAHYAREMSEVKKLLEKEQDFDTKAVLEKRLDVLQRRHEFVGKISKILSNLNHQLKLLEDSFGLINDEIRARSPEQILADVEEVVGQTDVMTKVLEEVAPYEKMVERLTA